MECEIECELECPRCHLNDEFCEEDINWEKVCTLLQDNPAICSERDDWDWYPLHFACYQNAPVSVIKKLVNIWPEGLNETVKMKTSELATSMMRPHSSWRVMPLHQMSSSYFWRKPHISSVILTI